jgi:hypothetical protein
MGRVKNGTRMSSISVINKEITSSWVNDHYYGMLKTRGDTDNMLSENLLTMETESNVVIGLDGSEDNLEITTISFVGNEEATPNASIGEFKV